jgi:DNA-binding NarL/FixJ family response regulator
MPYKDVVSGYDLIKENNMDDIRKKIILIEDNVELRHAYELIINGHGKFEVIGSYSSMEDALRSFVKELPDIVLADIELPGKSGVEGARIIKEKWPDIEVIMVTIYQDDELVFEALKAGASGYIIKGSSYTELMNALEEILRGGAPMSSSIARMVVNNFHISSISPLSDRERQILGKLALGKTYVQIAKDLFISKKTSRTHIRNIYLKLHVNSKSEAIERANKDKLI